jgi:hypothetical protein
MIHHAIDPFYSLYALGALCWVLLGLLAHRSKRRGFRDHVRLPQEGCTANAYELFRRLG